MIEPFISKFLTPTKIFNELSVLLAIQGDPKISQQKIGEIAHLSSSMVNNYMKKLQSTGLVCVDGDTNRSMSYHLTSSGRDKLVSSFIAYSNEIVQFYGAAKRELGKNLNELYLNGIRNVVLFGGSETCELVLGAIKETLLNVKAIVDSDQLKQGKFFNGQIIQSPQILKNFETDAVVVTSFGKQEEIYTDLFELVRDRVKIVKLTDLYAVHSY